jgi:hypothetical protein
MNITLKMALLTFWFEEDKKSRKMRESMQHAYRRLETHRKFQSERRKEAKS